MLAPGIREQVGRAFAGPLRPGIAGTVGATGGAVADASRESDLGMDHIDRDVDAIGKRCGLDITTALIAERERRNRRRE